MASGQSPKALDPNEYCPEHLFGTKTGRFECHLVYDTVIERTAGTTRHRFEAFVRAVRDVLSQRWVATEITYNRLNPELVYDLSMECLIGRSPASNVTNLLLDPAIRDAFGHHGFESTAWIEEEPDAAPGKGGLGRLAACFLQLPAIGCGLRYHYGLFQQFIQDGWQQQQPENWLRRQDPWDLARPQEQVDVKLNGSFEVRAGELRVINGRPSERPYHRGIRDRHLGGKTLPLPLKTQTKEQRTT